MRFPNFKSLIQCLRDDAYRYVGATGKVKLYFTVIGYRYTFWMRLCGFFRERKWLLPLYLLAWLRLMKIDHNSGIQIPAGTYIGNGFYIGHHGTIVVNGGTVIGRNVNISQGVTIGQANRGGIKAFPLLAIMFILARVPKL